jgi:superfamily II DNA/RNA helicase
MLFLFIKLNLCHMPEIIKNQLDILQKLGIESLNPMQEKAISTIENNSEIVLLSPTGTGKTLAFLLPIIASLDVECNEIQALIIAPSRELSIQIESVIRKMGTGFKANAIYGGRAGSQDKIDLKHRPAILIGTPGRIADRIRRDSFSLQHIRTLVLDEFDKSLEIGFEGEMSEILASLISLKKKILTSATQRIKIPKFVHLENPKYINFLQDKLAQLKITTVISPDEDKLQTLVDTLCHIRNQPGIIFCNFKDSIQEVSDFLTFNNIQHGRFHGGMEQIDREKSLIKFRNGTYSILVATDLAARGIDIPELKFILHYELPMRVQEFTHRNGRTARMNSNGTAYILKWQHEDLPEFINNIEETELVKSPFPKKSTWKTLYISGGRRDKISKGDIVGMLIKQGGLAKEDVGIIEVKQSFSFVAVKESKVNELIPLVNNRKLKAKKVRISIA